MTQILIEEFKKSAGETLGRLKRELSGLRTNRPTPALLEDLRVEYYGKILPLNQVGSLSIEPPRDIIIHVWDKTVIPEAIKAIEASALGLSLAPQGNIIRVHLPELSEERRAEIIKVAKRLVESNRIQIRHLRDEANKKIGQTETLSEDQQFKLKEVIQEETDRLNKEIESVLENKIKEINQ